MNKQKLIILGIVIIAIIGGYLVLKNDDEITTVNVQAAASMQNALDQIVTDYNAEGHNVVVNYGGSGTLVTQIQQGAPADIFISASQSNFDTLEETNPMQEQTTLVSNDLVLITNKDSNISKLEDADVIAIGTPDAVPAGTYAIQTLDKLGLSNKLADKLVQTKDVTEVLTYVETGDADVGFVYNTDALSSDKVKVIESYDESYHDPITYPIGLLTDNKEASDFYQYLNSSDAKSVFAEYGFSIDE